MTKARLLIAFGTVVCALAAMTTPAFALFLFLLAEGTKELATKIQAESKGEGEEFKAGGGIFKCEENKFYGVEEYHVHETNLILILPWYHGEKKGCTAEGVIKGKEGEVHHNGCHYILRQIAKGESPEKEPYTGAVNLECPEGKEVEFVTNLVGCTIFVGKKGNGSIDGVEILNLPETKPLDIHIVIKANNISYHDSSCIGLEKEGKNAEYIAPPILIIGINSAGERIALHIDPFTGE